MLGLPRWLRRLESAAMEGTTRRNTIRRLVAIVAACAGLGSLWAAASRWGVGAKRLRIVVPGRLVGGAWQNPGALRDLIERERIKTLVTLTAINRDDPKYVAQAEVVSRTGVDWIIVPMRGSSATLHQMADAADLLADPARQPIYFHCVAGHHRTSLAHAAYLIRHEGYTAERAWEVMAGLPWARPSTRADEKDRALIFEFARVQASIPRHPLPGELQAAHAATP
jgi:protein tyrosine phosphatase (PTP) superfamily phosphohydrolase (DUF442 family)